MAREARFSFHRVPYESRLAEFAVISCGVIFTFKTYVERIWSLTVTVAETVALLLTLISDESEVALAGVRRHAGAVHAGLQADRQAPGGRGAVPAATVTSVSMRSIRADLRLLLAVVVPVDAFVFRRTTCKMPGELRQS